MSFLPVYLDSSAIVKLIVREPESDALLSTLDRCPDRVASIVARVEVHRALRRVGASRALRSRAEDVLDAMVLVRIDEPVITHAARLGHRDLRALDAIQLATALTLGDDPEGFITYDARLARAASRERLAVWHPGVDQLV